MVCIADAGKLRDLGDLPAGVDQVEDTAAELWRIAAGHDGLRRLLDGQFSREPTPQDPGQTTISTDPGAVP